MNSKYVIRRNERRDGTFEWVMLTPVRWDRPGRGVVHRVAFNTHAEAIAHVGVRYS